MTCILDPGIKKGRLEVHNHLPHVVPVLIPKRRDHAGGFPEKPGHIDAVGEIQLSPFE